MAERLTMQEVIEHCERAVIQAEMLRFTDTKQYMEHKQVREWLEELQHYKDLEEQGRMITLPCKIGDTVYGIRRFHGDRIVKSGTVSEMFYNKNMELVIVIKNLCRGFWGENIFGTKEEAEAALKGAEE